MNYISHLNVYRIRRLQNPISTNAIALYFILLEYCNMIGWLEWFTVANSTLQGLSGLSRNALHLARNELTQKGYVKYKKGSGNQCGIYLIVRFDTQTDTQSHTQMNTQTDTQSGTQTQHSSGPLNKLNETKPNEKDILSDIQKESEWQDYVSMRKKIKKPLTDRAVKMAISKLEELAPGDLDQQKQILNQSTFHCWQGLFPLKPNSAVSPDYDDLSGADDTMQQLYGGRRMG